MSHCPCQSGNSFDECCGPVINDQGLAKTPEGLMRARYTAYVRGEINFISNSHHPDKREELNEDEAKSWSEDSNWLGLKVLDSSENGDEGEVLFGKFLKLGLLFHRTSLICCILEVLFDSVGGTPTTNGLRLEICSAEITVQAVGIVQYGKK